MWFTDGSSRSWRSPWTFQLNVNFLRGSRAPELLVWLPRRKIKSYWRLLKTINTWLRVIFTCIVNRVGVCTGLKLNYITTKTSQDTCCKVNSIPPSVKGKKEKRKGSECTMKNELMLLTSPVEEKPEKSKLRGCTKRVGIWGFGLFLLENFQFSLLQRVRGKSYKFNLAFINRISFTVPHEWDESTSAFIWNDSLELRCMKGGWISSSFLLVQFEKRNWTR